MKVLPLIIGGYLAWHFMGWYDLFPDADAMWPVSVSFFIWCCMAISLSMFFLIIESICDWMDKGNRESRK